MKSSNRYATAFAQSREEKQQQYFTGPGKSDPRRLIGVYDSRHRWVKDMKTEKEARQFVEQNMKSSRAGAKAKFAWSVRDAREAKELTDNFVDRIAAMDPRNNSTPQAAQNHLYSLLSALDEAMSAGTITRVESQEMKKRAIGAYRYKFSRAGAKAAFAHPLPASLESALRNLDVQVNLLRRAFQDNHLQGMKEIGSWVAQAAQKVQSIAESAADSAARVSPHSRTGAKSDGLTLAQRIAVEHDAKRMAAR